MWFEKYEETRSSEAGKRPIFVSVAWVRTGRVRVSRDYWLFKIEYSQGLAVISQLSTSNTSYRKTVDPERRRIALRTAFIARFIVLREGRRSRAHRLIEQLSWSVECTAQDIYRAIRDSFIKNGDKLGPVDRDLRRALEHAERSVDHFIGQYCERATLNFRDALIDYGKSNELLFGEDPSGADVPRSGGWRLINS